MEGHLGIGCISDYEPQPLLIQSHLGSFAITTVGKINNMDKLLENVYGNGRTHFQEMSTGQINATELAASLICSEKNDYGRYSSSAGCGGWLHDAAFDDERRNLRRP